MESGQKKLKISDMNQAYCKGIIDQYTSRTFVHRYTQKVQRSQVYKTCSDFKTQLVTNEDRRFCRNLSCKLKRHTAT